MWSSLFSLSNGIQFIAKRGRDSLQSKALDLSDPIIDYQQIKMALSTYSAVVTLQYHGRDFRVAEGYVAVWLLFDRNTNDTTQ